METQTALQVVNKQEVPVVVHQPQLIPSTHELQVYQVMASQAANSKFYSKLGGEAGIATIMLYARELGIPPMQAISGGLHNIQGNIEMSARMINMKIRQAGHILQILSLTNTECSIYGKRRDTGEDWTETYTIEDAKKAELVKPGGNWIKVPQDMLFARCISRIGRRIFADVIGTAYVEGEIREALGMESSNKSTHQSGENPTRTEFDNFCAMMDSTKTLDEAALKFKTYAKAMKKTIGSEWPKFEDYKNATKQRLIDEAKKTVDVPVDDQWAGTADQSEESKVFCPKDGTEDYVYASFCEKSCPDRSGCPAHVE